MRYLLWGGGLLLVVGLFNSVLAFRNYMRSEDSEFWPSVEGRLLVCRIDETSAIGRFGPGVQYVPHVEYEYTVDGVTYKSDKINAMNDHSFAQLRDAQRVTEQYLDDGFPVYYSPSDPGTSVLQTGFSVGGGFLCALGIMPLMLGFGLLVVGYHLADAKKSNAPPDDDNPFAPGANPFESE